ncbi:DinB family protein [Actinoalloteichus spitiensis]|uniref:DinB family protein n=1 Tax=Actinoalloteichus spitiensis TaxID=252394 RepID=UPI00036BD39F|nr:DinB family protein [Actinoalloteichus spitiensis]
MNQNHAKRDLRRLLDEAREAMLWKLAGLTEYDARRPVTPTGTNLLGLVKHVTAVEIAYLGYAFGRPYPEQLDWIGPEAEPNADMWATEAESREEIVSRYRRVWAHSDTTLDECALDAVGHVPWWPTDRATVTLHQVLAHVVAEVHRHAGHADLVRELLDGGVGRLPGQEDVAAGSAEWWSAYHARLVEVAEGFRQR